MTVETFLTNQWQIIVKLQFQWRNKSLDFTEADDYPVLINSQCSRKKGEVKTWHPDKLTSRLPLSLYCTSFRCLWFCYTYPQDTRAISQARLFARVSYRTWNVSRGTLVESKAWACHTKAAGPVFPLSIKYADIHEIGDTLSVPCHRTRACAITLFSLFPWRVTNMELPTFWVDTN